MDGSLGVGRLPDFRFLKDPHDLILAVLRLLHFVSSEGTETLLVQALLILGGRPVYWEPVKLITMVVMDNTPSPA